MDQPDGNLQDEIEPTPFGTLRYAEDYRPALKRCFAMPLRPRIANAGSLLDGVLNRTEP
jgi:hypothetical protein